MGVMMYWRQTKYGSLMVEVDGYGWLYNRLMGRFYPVVGIMQRDYKTVSYALLRG